MNALQELEALKLSHSDCEDGRYRCPKCGSEDHNAKADEINE